MNIVQIKNMAIIYNTLHIMLNTHLQNFLLSTTLLQVPENNNVMMRPKTPTPLIRAGKRNKNLAIQSEL